MNLTRNETNDNTETKYVYVHTYVYKKSFVD